MTERRRTNSRSTSGMYIDGNAVRKLQEITGKKVFFLTESQAGAADPKRATARKTENRARAVSRETIRNRQKAANMGRGFVIFLAVISAAVLFVCVNYLQLRAEVTGRIKNVAVLESELSELRAENDAYESQANSGTGA